MQACYWGHYVQPIFAFSKNKKFGKILSLTTLRCLYGIFKEVQSVVNLLADVGKIIPKEPLICYCRPKNLVKLHKMEDVVMEWLYIYSVIYSVILLLLEICL